MVYGEWEEKGEGRGLREREGAKGKIKGAGDVIRFKGKGEGAV